MDKNEKKNLFETANGRSVGSLAFTGIDPICGLLEFKLNQFSTRWKDHLKDAGLFQRVRTHGKWGCGNMVLPGAAEFCTVLFTVIFTNNGVHGEKLQLFCLQQAFWEHLLIKMKQMGKFRHQWFGDANGLPSTGDLEALVKFAHDH